MTLKFKKLEDYIIEGNTSIHNDTLTGEFKIRYNEIIDEGSFIGELFIEGHDIVLGKWELTDIEYLTKIANQKEISDNFIGFPYPYTEENALEWIKSSNNISLKILYKGKIVGGVNCDLLVDDNKKVGNISYWISPDFQGLGIGKKVVELFISYLFNNHNISELNANVFKKNLRSIKILLQLGFNQNGDIVYITDNQGNKIEEYNMVINREIYEKIAFLKKNIKKIINLFINYEDFISDFLGNKESGLAYKLILKNGEEIFLRSRGEDVSDIDIVSEIFISNDYLIEGFLGEGMTVIDIGGQIGIFSAYASQFVGNEGKIYSYEPFKSNFEILQLNSNSRSNIMPVNKGVSNKTGTAELFISEENVGGHSMINSGKGKSINISVISINQLFYDNGFDEIDLLKIDCEGEEYNIFEAIEDKNLNKIKRIYMEVHYNDEISKRYSKYHMVELLISKGFDVKVLKEFSYENEGEFYIVFAEKL